MNFNWPSTMADDFRRQIITASHDAQESALFTDGGLADLLDAYPRDRLGVYTFPEHGEGRVEAIHGRAPGLSGADILKAVQSGKIWLNLRAVNREVDAYSNVAEDLFAQLEAASGERVMKRDMGVLISSPNVHVHYHLDIPMVCLVQIRGEKTVHFYPAEAPYAPLDQIEAVALREREEDIVFRHEFDQAATALTLKPGMAVTWPQNAPHRVQNANCMNVSLSCEFMTPAALVRANAIYANGVLRRKFGASPNLPGAVGPSLVAKAALARAMKLVHRPPEKAPTPITFELDRDSGKVMAL